MAEEKKPYEKPEVKGAQVFETFVKTCCKSGACSTAQRTTYGKSGKSSNTS